MNPSDKAMVETPPIVTEADESALAKRTEPEQVADPRLMVKLLEPGTKIDPAEIRAHVACLECGAVVTFEGIVRATEAGKALEAIDYEYHEQMTLVELTKLARWALKRFGAARIAVAHRVGSVPVGEASVAIAVAAGHRGPAFAACESMIAELKATVPIWKAVVAQAGPQEGNGPLESKLPVLEGDSQRNSGVGGGKAQ